MKTFEELCQENYSRIYKYIFSMTGSKESTEDLIQEFKAPKNFCNGIPV